MATTARPKENSAVGKEKVISTNSQSTSTKKTTRPRTPSDKPSSSSEKEKQIPNYLKPTLSSRHESHSFKNSKTDPPQRTVINRRRSLDKPPSPSHLTKHNQSSSRLHKALVSPGPRERSGSQHRSLSFSSYRTTIASKSASEKTSRTSRDGKLSTNTKSVVNKSRKSPSPTPKKVACDGSTTANSTKAPKSDAETREELKNVETEAEFKYALNEKVEEVVMEDDNKQEESENATDQINSPVVNSENEHEHEHEKEHKQDQVVEESKPGEPQIQADDDNNNVIPTTSEEAIAASVADETKPVVEVEEAKREDPPEEKAEDVDQEDENNNPYESIDHLEPEEKKIDVEEKEEENDNGVKEEMDSEDNKEEKAEEGKEVAKGETDEEVKFKEGEDDDDNDVEKSEVKEVKAESTPKQQGAGKKETTQVYNEVIEETASKLEKRTNRIRALAGAFQTVIDHQSK